jgi:hypothetical protein
LPKSVAASAFFLRLAQYPLRLWIAEFFRGSLEAASNYAENARYAACREKFYNYVWRWLGRLAHLGFLVGLALLLAFAIRNM